MVSDLDKHKPLCPMTHDLINKLSVIVGNCDLVMEQIEEKQPDLSMRVQVIREIAHAAARELGEHQGELEAMNRTLT
jgi:hypothetical protein